MFLDHFFGENVLFHQFDPTNTPKCYTWLESYGSSLRDGKNKKNIFSSCEASDFRWRSQTDFLHDLEARPNLPTFPKRQCLETGELTKFFEYFKGFCRFTLSGHFWIRKVSRNRRFDQILWILQGILSFYCFQTLLNSESVYKHEKRPNPLNTKVSRNMETANSFEYGMCQETWKRPIPLTTNVSGNMETTNSFEYGMKL